MVSQFRWTKEIFPSDTLPGKNFSRLAGNPHVGSRRANQPLVVVLVSVVSVGKSRDFANDGGRDERGEWRKI